MTEKNFLITIDFGFDVCPYSRGDGCDHPKMFKYLNCLGVDQPSICPMVGLDVLTKSTWVGNKKVWIEK